MKLGEVIRKWRQASDLTLKEASGRIGLSLATMSRVERGENLDGATLAKILCWLLAEVAR